MNTNTARQREYDGTVSPSLFSNEWALVQQAIAGDANALEDLFAPNLGKLFRVALAMLRNREDAEDALQNGLCNAYTKLRSFRGSSSFSTWLFRIVVNSALMTLRQRRNHLESSLDEMTDDHLEGPSQAVADQRPNPEQICAMVELNALIEEQVLRLPESERAAFLHYAVHGHSMMESCLTFGVPASTFKSRMLRTRRKLAHGLQHSLGKPCAAPPNGKSHHVAQR